MEHYAICFPVGLGSVRVGNFMGGELLGRPTEVSWGVIFSNDPEGLLRHPSQLYQAFSEGFILFYSFCFTCLRKLILQDGL